jgi:hypothetical protein
MLVAWQVMARATKAPITASGSAHRITNPANVVRDGALEAALWHVQLLLGPPLFVSQSLAVPSKPPLRSGRRPGVLVRHGIVGLWP